VFAHFRTKKFPVIVAGRRVYSCDPRLARERLPSGSAPKLMLMRNSFCRLAIGFASALAWGDASAVAAPANRDWPAYLGDPGRSLYSPLKQINRRNVTRLKVAWTYDTGDKSEYEANNLIVAGVLYTPTPTRKVIALNAATGRELWKWDPRSERPGGEQPGARPGVLAK
jgi:hypothetical protein